ncbi:MAG: 2-hydroxychromene-2-carboxylate isomerase, partial [Pseudomonadota bacterium]|nr:2-hydroxychromene-2-carboxylate isomerase [Pseudomonadota bacterium]
MSHPGSSATALEIWFEFASNYSYLSVMRIEEAAARVRVPIR